MVTVGVSEAIDATLRAVIDPGDEVIIPDPGYVAYEADVTLSGGVVVPVATRVDDEFEIKAAAIEAALTPRSKVILLGNPNNPTGAVIARAELEKIAELAQRHDLLIISDEVYSRLVYGEEHVSIAALPGMSARRAGGWLLQSLRDDRLACRLCLRRRPFARSDPQGPPVHHHVRADDEPGGRAGSDHARRR